ncbi:sex comb on midleg-like protein 2 isoform X4 [Dendrobates tinctorius]|uniref:sex comb on midleg-like protein 2 isoform X4 n=1 Tax=Dendrobates tinctorius TaxID=92724 RepID=UPI003CCA3215
MARVGKNKSLTGPIRWVEAEAIYPERRGPSPKSLQLNDWRHSVPTDDRVGGRLLRFSHVWVAVTRDTWVAELVSSGYKIEFVGRPPQRFFRSRLSKTDSQAESLLQAVTSLQHKGVIAPVPQGEESQGFYSNLFSVPKKDGTVRPVLDLKILNRFIRVRRFRMESLRSVIAAMDPGEFLASIDVQDAYLHIPIFPSHQRFLRFAIGGRHFQFVALPFGLATAPRVFTKIMAVVMAILHARGITVLPYLDDLLVKGPSFQECQDNVSITLDTLARLGWLINWSKSSLVPAQKIVFLGMIFDTSRGLVILPQDKAQKIKQGIRNLLQPGSRSIRYGMSVLGRMVAAIEAIPFAQFHLRPLQHALLTAWDRRLLSLSHRCKLSPLVRGSLRWWTRDSSLVQGKPFPPEQWLVVTTDASLQGWGAVFQSHIAQGRWSVQEIVLPINILEIRAIRLALQHFQCFLRHRPVRIQTDNATAVAYVNHQGGTRSQAAMREVGLVLRWAEKNRVVISAVHIPGVENWAADFLSRQGVAAGEWSLHPEIFQQICQRWGTPDVDLMASRENAKVLRFVARSLDPQAIAADALVLPWNQFRLPYLFPPLPLLPRVIRKIRREKVPAILLAPDWPRRAWYADLVQLVVDVP